MNVKNKLVLCAFLILGFAIILTPSKDSSEPVSFELAQIEPIVIEEPVPALPDIDVDQMHCMAKNIYFEARGESRQGKIAVGYVTLNRVNSSRYPDTICDVVYQAKLSQWWLEHNGREVPIRYQCQFTWYCDGLSDDLQLTDHNGRIIKINLESWEESLQVASMIIQGLIKDNTEGATHYFNPRLADPDWQYSLVHVKHIDNHSFYTLY